MTKKIKSLFLVVVMVIGFVTYTMSVSAAVPSTDTAVPLYNNTSDCVVTFVISDSGEAGLTISCLGYSGVTTKIVAKSYIQLKTGSSWVILSNGEPNSQWVDTAYGYRLNASHSMKVSKGTYMAVVLVYVDGTGGDTDLVPINIIRTYS